MNLIRLNVVISARRKYRLADGPSCVTVTIDNSPNAPPATADGSTIPGDNSAFEFSGWQKGLETLQGRKQKPDLFLLTNDMALAGGQAALPVISEDILTRAAAAKAMAGIVRRIPCKASYQGLNLGEYVQTHFFVLPREVVEKLGSVVSFPNANEFLWGQNERDQRSEGPFKPHEVWAGGFDKYLFHMLTQRWHHHGIPYTPDNYPFFKRKVQLILNELMLTARVRTLGYPIMDLTPMPWLFNSFSLWNLPGRPVAPWQGIRNTIFCIFDLIFFSRVARKIGLDQTFRGWCERSWKGATNQKPEVCGKGFLP